MMRLKATIINLMVFPIIHQFLKIFYLIAVLFEVLLQSFQNTIMKKCRHLGSCKIKKSQVIFYAFWLTLYLMAIYFPVPKILKLAWGSHHRLSTLKWCSLDHSSHFLKLSKKPRIEPSNIIKKRAKYKTLPNHTKVFSVKIQISIFANFQ